MATAPSTRKVLHGLAAACRRSMVQAVEYVRELAVARLSKVQCCVFAHFAHRCSVGSVSYERFPCMDGLLLSVVSFLNVFYVFVLQNVMLL
jgi:hypothetical protein